MFQLHGQISSMRRICVTSEAMDYKDERLHRINIGAELIFLNLFACNIAEMKRNIIGTTDESTMDLCTCFTCYTDIMILI